MKGITSTLAADFWEYMTQMYGAKVLPKDDDLIKIIRALKRKDLAGIARGLADLNEGDEIGLIALFLSKLGHMDVADFMEGYSTTLGDRIYVPFTPGEEEPGQSLLRQVTTCVHELVHVRQFRRAEVYGLSFAVRYLVDPAQRALYEAEALRAGGEVLYFLSERELTKEQFVGRAEHLDAYGCSKKDIDVAKNYLAMSFKTIEAGGRIDTVAKRGVDWLERHL